MDKPNRHKNQHKPDKHSSQSAPENNTDVSSGHNQDSQAQCNPPEEHRVMDAIKKTTTTDRITAGATIIIAVVTTIYTFFSCQQWNAMLDSNRINRQSLETVQRAFVGIETVHGIRVTDGKHYSWQFTAHWMNNGVTPAQNTVNYFGMHFAGPFTQKSFKGEEGDWQKSTIGAKSGADSAQLTVSETLMFGIGMSDDMHELANLPLPEGIKAYGWLVYKDVFPRTKPHSQ